MRQGATRELLTYWNRLRGDRAAPDRAEIELAAIRGSLRDLFMLDLDPAHQFPFLMTGTRLNAFFCGEQLGRSFLSLWQPQDARTIATALMTAIDAACPVLAAASAHPEGYRDADLEILFVPLRHGGQAPTRLLGMATPTVQPPWVGLLPVPHFNLRALRAVEADSGWMNLSKASALALAARARVTERPADIRGHLRIFEGGK
ncbi:PAS domain-containing protein [uncultured Methylovirgula sp.]|uniref:PAS domain-containing protein n=1 Tax=uncultured Methylovirgula sp. TaxID=1285960 RepID=UPI0026220CD6|nr:PAS domain-containing protein [uncultured Methylovirgula sp.]